METTDIPIYFTAERELNVFTIFVGLGAALGAVAYCHNRWVSTNLLNQVNRRIVEEYHPNLLK